MAGILGTGGQIKVIDSPTGLLPKSADILAFSEQKEVTFPVDGVTLDQGNITAGTLVDSFFLSFNPENLYKIFKLYISYIHLKIGKLPEKLKSALQKF